MPPEFWNFDTYEKPEDTPTNINRSAEDFAFMVQRWKDIKTMEAKDPNDIPTNDDIDKAFDWIVSTWPQLWSGNNPNASNKVTFPEKAWHTEPRNIQSWPWIKTETIYQNNPNGSINIWVKN